jgi:uncharacterized protein (TIGR03435 family)
MATDYFANPVIDSTGLQGAWDFDLKWSPRIQLATAGSDGISIVDAIAKQLGLNLTLKQMPLPVVAIEHVTRNPTPNSPEVSQKLPAAPSEFEVAAVKPSPAESRDRRWQLQAGGRVDMRGLTLKDLITFAWGISPDVLVGAPKWLDTNRFDIIARAPSIGPAERQALTIDELRPMLRTLVVDRFKLALHNEDRPVPVYAMTLPRHELKARKAEPGSIAECRSAPPAAGAASKTMLTAVWTCHNMTMPLLAQRLREIAPFYVDHMVVDATGLDGGWDFTVSWTPASLLPRGAQSPDGAPGAADPSGAMTLFEAVDKQIGLKLELQKRMTRVFVIDRVEQTPAEN